jgi:putative DNA primase/helicase
MSNRALQSNAISAFYRIPRQLRERAQWVCWREEEREGRSTKVPYQIDGRPAKVNDPQTWTTFNKAIAAYESDRGRWSGIGYVFAADDEFFGIDLDSCVFSEGRITKWGQRILSRFGSYAEVSPSGSGFKIIGIGKPPFEGGREFKGNLEQASPDKSPEICVYGERRFFCLTGDVIDGHAELRDFQQALIDLCKKLWPDDRNGKSTPPISPSRPAPPRQISDPIAFDRCLAALRSLNPVDNADGSHRLFCAACTAVGFGLTDDDSLSVIRRYETERPFPRSLTDEDIERRIRDARQRVEQPEPSANGEPQSAGAGVHPGDWPAPKPLPSLLPQVTPFDVAWLPKPFQAWIADISSRMQCPLDYPAVASMIVLATVVGRKCGIRPKRCDDWLVVPNMWGVAIGRPGLLKTPSIGEPIKFLDRLEVRAKEEFAGLQEKYRSDKIVRDAKRKAARHELAKAFRSKVADSADDEMDDPGEHADFEQVLREAEPDAPVRRRFIVRDSTAEMLGVLLNENPNGFAVVRDELVGLLRALEKTGQEQARAFLLECWNGYGRFSWARIGRGNLDVESCCLSVFGAATPGGLHHYLQQARQGGDGDDGLIQRFQLAVWPESSTTWENIDRWPNKQAKDEAWSAVERLVKWMPTNAQQDPDGDIPYLRFRTDAQPAFDEWRAHLEKRLRNEDLPACVESHLSKYRSLIPTLALLISLCEDPDAMAVDRGCLDRAIEWGRYLESHARKIYAVDLRRDIAGAHSLVQKILDGSLHDGFALKQVYRPHWSNLADRDAAGAAVDLLMELGWLREETEATSGRPRTTYYLHPEFFSRLQKSSAAESPADVPF